MGKVASVLKDQSNVNANVIFLTWHIPLLSADGIISLLFSYYKTMANYELIMNKITKTLSKIVEFVEVSHKQTGYWKTDSSRAKYYSQFRFYGHSLGSHVLADAIHKFYSNFNNQQNMKFGQVVGLDPANPCFLNNLHGISKEKLAKSVNQVMIVHSNAGLAGSSLVRANIEVVLNGGTFQPDCSWYDMSCHHMRATDIFAYHDDQCMMVAYACSSYEQFKLGACETNDFDNDEQISSSSSKVNPNYVLVNLKEQHTDNNELVLLNENEQVRQIAEENDTDNNSPLSTKRSNVTISHGDTRHNSIRTLSTTITNNNTLKNDNQSYASSSVDRQFYYVNTKLKLNTHCLQHYQLRLVVLDNLNSIQPAISEKCPLGSFLNDGSNQIKILLLADNETKYDINSRVKTTQQYTRPYTLTELNPIITNQLYTGLNNHYGKPELFTGAIINNINLDDYSNCLNYYDNDNIGFRFVIDIAFMSHIKRK